MEPIAAETVLAQIATATHTGDTIEIDRAGAMLDRLDQAEHERLAEVALCGSALWYANTGLAVFPIQSGLKIPYPGTRGFKDATTDPDQIRAWWTTYPDANIGIATGHLVDVIDIDGPVGVQSWAKFYDDLPPTIGKVSTPRPGGNHLYVPASGLGNKAGMYPGIDYRGLGGYVVAPPSVNGQGRYVWYQPLGLGETT